MNKYDVIVIGAGLGGLSCAARLSALGYRTAVFESHTLAGGFATEFKRKGYTFDVSLHGVGGLEEGSFAQLLKDCKVDGQVVPLRKKHPYSIRWEGQIVDIPSDVQEYVQLLKNMFPAEQAAIDSLFAGIHRFEEGFSAFSSSSLTSWRKAAGLLKAGIFFRWTQMTTWEAVSQFGLSEKFTEFFTALWPYYGLPPKRLAALYFFIPWIGYHLEGTYYIQGGAQALSNALVAAIESAGGEVHLRSQVSEIVLKGGKAVGVRLKKGDVYEAKWIVSGISPHHTYGRLLSNHDAARRELEAVSMLETGTSLTQLYLGLSCEPRELGITEEDLILRNEPDSETDYEVMMSGQYTKGNWMLTNYNAMDPTLNEPGKGVIAVTFLDRFENWPATHPEYKAKKEAVIRQILELLEQLYPGFGSKVVVAELGTPRTMQRYTANPDGAVYGYAQTVRQSGIKRLKRKTAVNRLSLVGAWTQPGGGFQGAMNSGIMEADRISAKLGQAERASTSTHETYQTPRT
ncbi:phytoene desaturase family protein [Paenibacillus terrae]|uniref:Phytoene dehydrogenase n=1 Tax=Paenibacillus terrae TaxID=159743 RepID=A0A0D7X276_9BACL|nr:NAD(P)/FAD-dependent oxidoreductase [Paenibacillus terrae]KJD45515.1 phytoene dehydrogenase [Paenibacillus terrae]